MQEMTTEGAIRVGVLYPKDGYKWQRQIPIACSAGIEFSLNQPRTDDDWLFVYEGLSQSVSTWVPRSRRVFVCGEPASIKSYSARFLAQFGNIWTTDPRIDHPGAILHHPCTPWHVGAYLHPDDCSLSQMDITELASCSPRKTKLISVISSNKTTTKGHRDRLTFVESLKREFGDSLDVYGRGINDFEDKWDALAEYKYHIAIENSSYPDYWTEKLADPILTLSYPIYSGCPNIYKYFSEKAIDCIDLTDASTAIQKIRRILEAETYDTRVRELEAARRKLIAEFNFFAEIARHVAEHTPKHTIALASPEPIRPEKSFDHLKRAIRRVRRLISSKAGL